MLALGIGPTMPAENELCSLSEGDTCCQVSTIYGLGRSQAKRTLQWWVELSSLLIVDKSHSEHGANPEEGNVGCNDEYAIPAARTPSHPSSCSCGHLAMGASQSQEQSHGDRALQWPPGHAELEAGRSVNAAHTYGWRQQLQCE